MHDLDSKTPANRTGSTVGEARQSDKRRSTRVVIDIPVTVFGQNSDGKIFTEQSSTVKVSAHGALIVMTTDIDSQKPALLMNTKTGSEVQCRVAHRKEIEKCRFEIGFEFASPYPRFWGINFPPVDWNPADRKKATSPQRILSAPTKGLINK